MISFRVKADTKDLERHLRAAPAAIRRAQIQALNKTAPKVRTATVRDTAKAVSVKQKLVRERVYFKGRLKARRGSLEAVVLVKEAGIPAMKLGTIKSRRAPKGQRGGGGVQVGRRRYPHAFVAQMPNGQWMVVQRKGRARLPIEAVRLQLTPHINRAAATALRVVGAREYPVELRRSLTLQLRKLQATR